MAERLTSPPERIKQMISNPEVRRAIQLLDDLQAGDDGILSEDDQATLDECTAILEVQADTYDIGPDDMAVVVELVRVSLAAEDE